ncbi:Fic family protein [Candidatus Woesearchaeota archaeon]|nr:Fic family protein [Candidatus Woesearchaeota archaeon]
MVYLERKQIKGQLFYYLVHTLREGNKIVHKRKYVGTVLPSKKELERIEMEFIKDIGRDKKYVYLSSEDVEKIEGKKKKSIQEVKKLSFLEKEKRLKDFIIRFTYDSSKLSGVDITLRQTFLILKENLIPKDLKYTKTIKELENHEKGILVITKYKGAFSINFIKKLHKILLSGIDDSVAGKTRDELQRNVKLAGTPYVPPKWQEVKKELINFFKWYKDVSRKLHPVELAALVHLKIISIQPFVDGNSRLSRLLMNWILWKKKYPPVEIPIEELENYYQVLDLYQIEDKEKPFVDYVKERYLKSD